MMTRTYNADPTIHHYWGPWQQLVKLSRCLCEDGVERTINVREPDTFFTIPGRTHAHGKTVSGYVSYDSDKERLVFHAMGKNMSAIVSLTTCTKCGSGAIVCRDDLGRAYCQPHIPSYTPVTMLSD